MRFAVPFELLDMDIILLTISIPYPSERPGYAGIRGDNASRMMSFVSESVNTPISEIVLLE